MKINRNAIKTTIQSAPTAPPNSGEVAGGFLRSRGHSSSPKAACHSFRRMHLKDLFEDYADVPVAELTSHMVRRAVAKRLSHNLARSREARTRYTTDSTSFSNN